MRNTTIVATGALLLLTQSVFAGEKPPTTWAPANAENFRRGRSQSIRMVVIHTSEGSFSSCINWFKNPSARVSAHFLVGQSGQIAQMVGEGDTAWHAGQVNGYSIGIEHEGFYNRASTWNDSNYRASAKLTRYLCDKYHIPIDRQHILGHVECPGANHADPGRFFDWDLYMLLVRGEGGDTGTTTNPTDGTSTPSDGTSTPSDGSGGKTGTGGTNGSGNGGTNGSGGNNGGGKDRGGLAGAIERGADSTPDAEPLADPEHPQLGKTSRGRFVEKLQKMLKANGHDIAVDGIFGPETEKAVEAYQKANGLGVDGIVGPKTWGSLEAKKAEAARAATPPAPERRPTGSLGGE